MPSPSPAVLWFVNVREQKPRQKKYIYRNQFIDLQSESVDGFYMIGTSVMKDVLQHDSQIKEPLKYKITIKDMCLPHITSGLELNLFLFEKKLSIDLMK